MRVSVLNGLFLFTLTVVIALAISENDIDKRKTSTTTEISTSTENPSTSESTSSPPTTTVEKSTTTATQTTTAPTTTAPTTTAPTTPAPTTPPPEPRMIGMWNVRNEENHTCIMLNAEIRMVFNYQNKSDKKMVLNHAVIVPTKPSDSKASGYCGENEQAIHLQFYNNWNLTLRFNLTNSKYEIDRVMLKYSIVESLFPNATQEQDKKADQNRQLFSTDEKKSYECAAKEVIYNNTLPENETGLTEISVQYLHVQAFLNSTSADFSGGVNHCSQDQVSQLVPIIVGATLAGLIIVVLIAYLIDRRRSRRGYESV